MSKRSLLLSTASVALLASAAFADTTIDKSTTTALATSTAGNVTVASGGAISVSSATTGAITVDSNNFVLNQGNLTNKDSATATGILVNMNKNPNPLDPANTANTSAIGIDLASASTITLSGSGATKRGIWLNNTDTVLTNTYTYNGPITLESGSSISVTGDSSEGIAIDNSAILKGNLTIGGALEVTPASTTSTSATGMYGVLVNGQVQGNISIPTGGSVLVHGAGATGMSIQGTGVTGSIAIGGSLTAQGTTASTTITNTYTNSVNTLTNPEAGSALAVSANVGGGIAILGPTSSNTGIGAGSVTTQGTSAAIDISPSLNTLYTSQGIAPSTPLTIGVYTQDTADPGFSFYNRGAITAAPSNYNDSALGIHVAGYSAALPTVLTGGFYNSGSIGASASTTGNVVNGNQARAVVIDNYAQLQAGSGKNAATSASEPGDQAAFVNSGITGGGSISASISGTRGGSAVALVINQFASVPSLINTGTISATATTTVSTLAGNVSGSANPLQAAAIVDLSGSLTSIYNTGTISAQAGFTNGSSVSALDNNSQIATAIDLSSGSPTTASGSGVDIKSYSSASSSATINGNILFGTGNNQILDLLGNGPSHLSTVSGNVSYGLLASGNTSGDQLIIGNYSTLAGIVTAPDGVSVDISNHGTLALQNSTTALQATTFHVANGGNVSLAVSQSLTSSGVVAAQTVNIDPGANLGVAYASFVPQGNDNFVLMTANKGQLNIDPTTIDTYNTALGITSGQQGGALPYLFQSASLSVDKTSSTSVDKLVLAVTPKTATQLGLTAGSYGMSIFPYANAALSIDNTLGSAMVNGIHNAAQAQAAYNSFAPNVTGGSRAIAISITDQATGVVGAHQRALRMYGKQDGEMTLWGDEFVEMIKDPGRGASDPNTVTATSATGTKVQSGFKDHGFGFALGLDGGSPKYGWYGGAFTFYAGDVGELARDSHTNQQWYILSLYSSWRGRGLFFDSKVDAGYGHVDGKRFINLQIPTGSVDSSGNQIFGTYTREADNKHGAALLSGGFSTGGIWSYGAATFMPQVSIDGLVMREDGYTETNPGTATVGDGFDLAVQPYYAQSLRAFVGASVRYDIDLWDFYLQPEARAGYRYDFFNDPVKLKAAFAHANVSGGLATAGGQFTVQGPDPSQGNFVLGGSLAATTDTWTMGFNFDVVRGDNGAFEQVGTLNILGRI